jgi:hypothetical protein
MPRARRELRRSTGPVRSSHPQRCGRSRANRWGVDSPSPKLQVLVDDTLGSPRDLPLAREIFEAVRLAQDLSEFQRPLCPDVRQVGRARAWAPTDRGACGTNGLDELDRRDRRFVLRSVLLERDGLGRAGIVVVAELGHATVPAASQVRGYESTALRRSAPTCSQGLVVSGASAVPQLSWSIVSFYLRPVVPGPSGAALLD